MCFFVFLSVTICASSLFRSTVHPQNTIHLLLFHAKRQTPTRLWCPECVWVYVCAYTVSYHRKSGYIVHRSQAHGWNFVFSIYLYMCWVLRKGYTAIPMGWKLGVQILCGLYIPHRESGPGDWIFSPSSLGGLRWFLLYGWLATKSALQHIPSHSPPSTPTRIQLVFMWSMGYGHTRWNYILLFLAFQFEVYVFSLRSILILIYSFNLTLI